MAGRFTAALTKYFLVVSLGFSASAPAAAAGANGGALSRWAAPTGNPGIDAGRAWVAAQAGLRANIERGRVWTLGDFTSGTASYLKLKSQGVVGVRIFFPWRYSVDMMGIGVNNLPSDASRESFMNAATNALRAGLYVQMDLMDVLDTPDVIDTAAARSATLAHTTRFAEQIVDKAARDGWDWSKIAIGPVNEWAGADNNTYNSIRLELHRILRERLPQQAILVTNGAYWGDLRTLDNSLALPTDGGPLTVQIHNYSDVNAARNSSHWAWMQQEALRWSDANGGVSVTLGEYGIWDGANDHGYLTNTSLAAAMTTAIAEGAPELRPAIWTITSVGAWYNVNNQDGSLTDDVAAAFASGTARIRQLADAPAEGSTPPPQNPLPPTPTHTIAATGTSNIDIRNVSAVNGFSEDSTGTAFNWGFMQGQGSYLEYSLNVLQAGTYDFKLRYATPLASGVDLLVNGTRVGGIALPATGTFYDVYKESAALAIALPAGAAVKLRIVANNPQYLNISGASVSFLRATTEPEVPNPPPSVNVVSEIRAQISNKCVEVAGKSLDSGIKLLQRTCGGADHQRFRFVPATQGRYTLQAVHSGLCVDLNGKNNGVLVRQRACNAANPRQLFTPVRLSDGSFQLKNPENRCLAVLNASLANGAGIVSAVCGSANEQKFTIAGLVTANPNPPTPPTNPTPSRNFVIVTAGQSNAGFRLDDGGLLKSTGWDWPLWTKQVPFLKAVLGLANAYDSGHRYGGTDDTSVGGCALTKSADGGCHFLDDMTSKDPASWRLSDVGPRLANNIVKAKEKGEVVFVSWIQGEQDASMIQRGMYGQALYGFSTEAWGNHYKDALKQMLVLLRQQTGVPNLRLAVQLIANYEGRPDLIRQAQLDAAAESNGDIIIANANPWQHYRPNGADWAHYNGQAYMDFTLEGARAMAYALRKAGMVDSRPGPGYGEFPRITSVNAAGSTIDIIVSNPNGASRLLLPATNPTQGWAVSANGSNVGISSISQPSPFRLRLTLTQSVAGNIAVTYGTEANRPSQGSAITDDAASTAPADAVEVERENMPLAVKPR